MDEVRTEWNLDVDEATLKKVLTEALRSIASKVNRGGGGGGALPIGTVLMYNGSGIANVATREVKLGDDEGDTVSPLPDGEWYVCNGNADTPNLINKFVRSEAASGTTDGSDDAIVVTHTHGYNRIYSFYVDQGGTPYYGEAVIPMDWNWSATRCTGASSGTIHKIMMRGGVFTSGSAGASGTGKNIPAYYSLIFIIRMA